MDLRQLTALVTVAEVGSVSRAAELLHLAQPTVTRQIRLLEEEIGLPLFERHRLGMVTTEAGDVLVERARRALSELERARAELRPSPGGVTGIVTVGLLESVVDLLAVPLTRAVMSRFPNVELRLLTAYSGHLQDWLDGGEVDMTLLYNLTATPSVTLTPLLTEQLWAVSPPGSALHGLDQVGYDQVAEQPLILPVHGHGLRALVDQLRAGSAVRPRVVAEVNSLITQKALVSDGLGWTILPAAGVAKDVAAGRLLGVPITEPASQRQVVLGLPRTGRMTAAAQGVARELIRLVRQLVRDSAWPGASLAGAAAPASAETATPASCETATPGAGRT